MTGHLADAQQVREYRNDLMHTGSPRLTLTFAEWCARIGRFLGLLPLAW